MLYNTHKRYGQLFGLGGLAVAGTVGTFDEVVKDVRSSHVGDMVSNRFW